jgi:predicted XRE-type DNA-binding protein
MTDADINQNMLSDILGISKVEVSYMMKHELAVREQNDIVAKVREWDALRKRGMA